MKKAILSLTGLLLAGTLLHSCKKDENSGTSNPDQNQKSSGKYDGDATVFVKAAMKIDLSDIVMKSVTLPMLQGWAPNGDKVYYYITESSDYDEAKKLGVNFSPIMKNAIGSQGVQNVTRGSDGRIQFKGNVDFSVVRVLIQGSPNVFPPSTAKPGAIGDAEYSPFMVLDGIVYNAPMVANTTGVQDRVLSIDYNAMTVTLLLSDGFFAGKQYFYHLVTDASDPVPATIENGIYAPRLKNLPSFGKNTLADASCLRGFALVGNGPTGINNPERQGLNSTIVDGGLEPINVFQQGPTNDIKENNNYSPMWDAHVYLWTDAAIAAGKRKRVHTLDEVKALLTSGDIISDPTAMNPPNPTIAGLKNNGLLINCSVIQQP